MPETVDWKWKLKDTLTTIAIMGNIVLLIAALFGLMRWMSETTSRMAAVEANQAVVVKTIDQLTRWAEESKTRWAVHDAVTEKAAETAKRNKQ
jgi:flagellar basal body-associated protein FliL